MSGNVYVDGGLKSYFVNIYQYVGVNLAVAGAVAFFISSQAFLFNLIMSTPLFYVVMFAPLGIAWHMNSNLSRLPSSSLQMWYWAYGAAIGASLSSIFVVYTSESIVKCFFIAAAVFLIAAVYGKMTSRDLSSMRATLMIALFGVIGVSLINFFMHNAFLHYVLSAAIVVIFAGYIAYDMQQLLAIYFTRQSNEMIEKISIMGALHLFISLINIFVSLLSLMGEKKRR